jgi:hypothetical protein
MKLTAPLLCGALAAALLLGPAARAQDQASALPSRGERAVTIEVDAEVIDVDPEERELVLELPTGERLTTVVDPAVRRLDEVAVGDRLVVTYTEAVAFDLRDPTDEELANPWVEGADAGISGDDAPPGGAMVAGVRAVCTIEGMNRLRGTVTIQDSRGDTHVVGGVTAERIESLRIGQPVVVTFTQALAVGIEKPGM